MEGNMAELLVVMFLVGAWMLVSGDPLGFVLIAGAILGFIGFWVWGELWSDSF